MSGRLTSSPLPTTFRFLLRPKSDRARFVTLGSIDKMGGIVILLMFLVGPLGVLSLTQTTTGTGINFVNNQGRTGLLWSSIALAVLTSLLQGLVTTIVSIAEDQNMWRFRFRIARFEHYWWTTISVLLSTSFALIILSFLAGNTNDALGVLVLSTATTIAIVQYAIPAWRARRFIENRWLAWTGSSRTAISAKVADVCGDAAKWSELERINTARRTAPPSDEWGFAFRPPPGLPWDPTAILIGLDTVTPDKKFSKNLAIGPCVYDDGLASGGFVSLLWGEREGFRRRVSRAVNSMPQCLLKSKPFTTDGYNGEGLCLAMGILGRNKGLAPRTLIYDDDDKWKAERGLRRSNPAGSTSATLENTSAWAPRPNKVMRSYYARSMAEQYGGLSAAYLAAATELALLCLDVLPRALRAWLRDSLEHQSLDLNIDMSRPEVSRRCAPASPKATELQLQTLYRAQYVSMLLSLNYYPVAPRDAKPLRPDLHCFALLYLAEGAVKKVGDRFVKGERVGDLFAQGDGALKPDWWDLEWVRDRLEAERKGLAKGWEQPASWLLGLQEWPVGLERWPEWPLVVAVPVYDA